MSKKIVLIGANGLVGSNFVKVYKTKFSITCIDKENIDLVFEIDKKNVDLVIFAAHPANFKSKLFAKSIIDVQVNFLYDILEHFSDCNSDFIFFSSGSVYKKSTSPISINNSVNYESDNAYVLGKLFSEMLLNVYKIKYNSISVIRPFYIYGINQNENSLFGKIIKKVKSCEVISIDQNEGMMFNPINVEDLIRFLYLIIFKKKYGLKVYNLCGDEVVSLKEVIKKISALLKIEPNIYETSNFSEKWIGKRNVNGKCYINLHQGLSELL